MCLNDTASGVVLCESCGNTEPIDTAITRCKCGGLLSVQHQPAASGDSLKAMFDETDCESGVWRYAPIVHPSAAKVAVSHPEGNTPLLRRPSLSEWCGVEQLSVKHEGRNPTGSFKDRGMTVAVTQAKMVGAKAVACASTGNTSASLAAYAAQAGLPAVVFVPQGQVAMGKMAQALAYGAHTLIVEGDFDSCLSLVQQTGTELGLYLVNSINPFRLEGQKTIVLELLDQLAWQPPDWIVVPAGNLGNTAAFGKALQEAKAWGLIKKVPRIVAVQASGAAPFADSFGRDFDELVPVNAETVATAIRIGAPASYHRAVRSIGETNGLVIAVDDSQILEAKFMVDRAGIGCEPASAASIAGTRMLRSQKTIGPQDSVVAILTGHLLKDPGIVERMHQNQELIDAPNRPAVVKASLEAIRSALSEQGVA